MKTCKACGEGKPLDDFYVQPTGKPRAQCKSCVIRTTIERDRNLDEAAKVRRRKQRADSKRQRASGWSADDYDAAYEAQQGCCAICDERYDVLCADHCHATGAKRALLCHNCNKALGLFRDDADRLRAAAEYLVRYF